MLGMPLDAERERFASAFDRLDHAELVTCRNPEPRTEFVDGLRVQGVDGHARIAGMLRQQGARDDVDVTSRQNRFDEGRIRIDVPGIPVERTAPRDIQHLRATTYPEDGNASFERILCKAPFKPVSGGIDAGGDGHGTAVEIGADVVAPAYDQPVDFI